MNGLKDWEPDVEKRYKHIIENMIYVCELQSRNVFLWLCGVDPLDEYTTNTYWGSFLDEGFDKHMKEVWGVDKFDIVIGNPPYNENNSNNSDKIYFKFIKKSFNLLDNDKYLLYVLPDDSINYIINSENYHISIINSNNIVDRFFKGIGTKIVYFLSEKKIDLDKETKFIDSNNYDYINLSDNKLILMDINDTLIVNKIIKKSSIRYNFKNAKYNGNNFRIRFNSIAKPFFNLRGINFVCVDKKLLKKHNIDKPYFSRNDFKYGVIDHSTDRIEFYADKNFDNNKKRVCINTMGEINSTFDKNGELLLTDGCVYIEFENDKEANNFIDFINNNILVKYLQKVITHNTKNKFKILNYLPKIDLSKKIKDDDIFSFFSLTTDDINVIKKKLNLNF